MTQVKSDYFNYDGSVVGRWSSIATLRPAISTYNFTEIERRLAAMNPETEALREEAAAYAKKMIEVDVACREAMMSERYGALEQRSPKEILDDLILGAPAFGVPEKTKQEIGRYIDDRSGLKPLPEKSSPERKLQPFPAHTLKVLHESRS